MDFLLDTNICIYIIKKKPSQVLQKFQSLPSETVAVSSLTVAELKYGQPLKQQHNNDVNDVNTSLLINIDKTLM